MFPLCLPECYPVFNARFIHEFITGCWVRCKRSIAMARRRTLLSYFVSCCICYFQLLFRSFVNEWNSKKCKQSIYCRRRNVCKLVPCYECSIFIATNIPVIWKQLKLCFIILICKLKEHIGKSSPEFSYIMSKNNSQSSAVRHASGVFDQLRHWYCIINLISLGNNLCSVHFSLGATVGFRV